MLAAGRRFDLDGGALVVAALRFGFDAEIDAGCGASGGGAAAGGSQRSGRSSCAGIFVAAETAFTCCGGTRVQPKIVAW